MEPRTDKELLDSYAADGDEPAFAELVSRYHPMVYRTCWRLLGNDHDAEDAAQAAFLVLARKAGSLRQEGRLNGWLHRVARLTALEAVRKRAARERHQAEYAPGTDIPVADQSEADMEAVLRQVDTALDGLSVVLREAVVLRYLRGFNEQEAAAQAGCPVSAMKWRTSDGIAKLRARLTRRGVTLSGAALAGLLASEASAAVPETLLPSILASVKGLATATVAGTGATSTAVILAKGAMKAMFIAKLKTASLTAAACLVVAGSGVVTAKQLSRSPMPAVVAAPVSAGTPTSAEPGATVAQVKPSQTQTQPVSSPAGTIDEAELERRRRLEDAARMGATRVKPSSGTPLDEEKERRIQQELRQYPSSPKMPPPATEKGAIAGVVVDETGNPLNRVQMSLYGVGCNEYDVTHTGPDGAFLFEAVPANKPFALEACQRTGVADFVTPREPVTAVIGQTNHIGRLTLTARPAAAVGSVRGVVVGSPYAEFGQLRAAEMKGDPIPWKPVAGARVTISIPQCKDYVGAETRVETKSGPDGSFTFDKIPVHSGVALRVNSPDRKQEGGTGYLRVLSGQVTDAGTVQIRPPYPWPADHR